MKSEPPERHGAPTPRSRIDVEQSLPSCFERQANLHPHRIALCSGAWRATYAELNNEANRLAHALLARGGVLGGRVAILMQHDTPLITATLAVLKAGSMAVVLDPTEPPARLGQVMDDADPTVILTDAAHREIAERIAGDTCGVLCVEDRLQSQPAPNPGVQISPDDVAFLVYTSGSTGPPKGVMQSHRNILHKALRLSRGYELQADDRIVLLASLSRGQGVNTTWCALAHGAALCPFPIMTKGVTGLADWMVTHGITVFVSAASVFRHFIMTLEDTRRFHKMHLVWLASESATSEDFESWKKHFTEDCVLLHTLSSSETGTITQLRLARNDTVAKGLLPVGRPTEDVEVLLHDENGRAVQGGEAGEIVVRSRYLSTGYWRNESLTQQHFSGIAELDGPVTFRSGDRGRMTAEGLLMFMGRQDTRVTVHGYRIELAEIEGALSREASVERAAVRACAQPSGDVQLAAYVTLRPGRTSSASDLRQALRGALPGHMIPAAFIFLENFPLTPNGKIDRRALARIVPPASKVGGESAPTTETEALLASIWSDAMNKDMVGRDDDFFDLGGDSLVGVVVAAKVHDALQVEMDLRMFSDHPKLAALASVIDDLRRTRRTGDVPRLLPAPRDVPLPLSFTQERVWKYSQTIEGCIAYNMGKKLRILERLDVAALRDCMSYIARRHEILRTTFTVVDGQPVQIVHPPEPTPLPLLDFAGMADAEEQATRFMRNETSKPVDLQQGPLLRFFLLRIREDEHWLIRICHHILVDEWAWRIYFRELSLLYESRLRGEPPPLPASVPLQYADYAVWQRQFLRPDGTAFQETIAWWKETFAGSPDAIEFSFKRQAPLQTVDPGEGLRYGDLDPVTTRLLDQIARDGGATVFVVRLAAFSAALANLTGQRDIVLGTYATTRNRVELQEMFGDFGNLVTLRLRPDLTLTFREWVEQVRNLVGEVNAHSEIPYEMLCEELRQQGVKPPEIRAIFALGPPPTDVRFRVHEEFVTSLAGHTMPWGFTMRFGRGKETEWCHASFDAGIYDSSRVRLFIGQFQRFLGNASALPDRPMQETLREAAAEFPGHYQAATRS